MYWPHEKPEEDITEEKQIPLREREARNTVKAATSDFLLFLRFLLVPFFAVFFFCFSFFFCRVTIMGYLDFEVGQASSSIKGLNCHLIPNPIPCPPRRPAHGVKAVPEAGRGRPRFRRRPGRCGRRARQDLHHRALYGECRSPHQAPGSAKVCEAPRDGRRVHGRLFPGPGARRRHCCDGNHVPDSRPWLHQRREPAQRTLSRQRAALVVVGDVDFRLPGGGGGQGKGKGKGGTRLSR